MKGRVKLMQGDCLELMKKIPDNYVDMILCDLPYGTTNCKWDIIIPFEPLWEQYNRVCKKKAIIILFSQEPFTSLCVSSNISMFRYDLIWNKRKTTGFLNAKRMPLRQHENILVFYKKLPIYNPILHTNKLKREFKGSIKKDESCYGKQYEYERNVNKDSSYPRSIIEQTAVVGNSNEKVAHPTQKPVTLFEYLINTYTDKNMIILDNCAGSGTTGIAALNTGRKAILIEKDDKYFEIMKDRVLKRMEELYGKELQRK